MRNPIEAVAVFCLFAMTLMAVDSRSDVPVYVDGVKSELTTSNLRAIRLVTYESKKPEPRPIDELRDTSGCEVHADPDCNGQFDYYCPGRPYTFGDYDSIYAAYQCLVSQ